MNKNIIIVMIAAVFMLSSCGKDFLSPAPVSSVGSESFYTNDTELEMGVVNMYDGIKGVNSTSTNDNHGIQIEFQLTEMRSDNTRTKSSEGEQAQFERFEIQATNGVVADYYKSFYNVIYRANVVLSNLDAASTQEIRDQFEAEALFVRAYANFNLVRLYGDIPLVENIITPDDPSAAYDRRPVSEVYTSIVNDLISAEAKLEATIGNKYKGRASAGAAQALLGKVYLTLGQYSDARSMLSKVIGGGYSLAANFEDVFYDELNDEIIFAIEYNSGNASFSQNFSAEWLNAVGRTSGINYVTDEAVLALSAMGGDRASSYRPDALQAGQFQVTKYLPDGNDGGDDGKTFPAGADPTLAGNDWIILRYADVLLMYVEAVMEGNPSTGDATAIQYFEDVRGRAGLTDPVSSITQQELLDERRVELAFENHRWFDLIRFGVAETVLSAYSDANGYSFTSTDLLLPIPEAEIGYSKGTMNQNPGY